MQSARSVNSRRRTVWLGWGLLLVSAVAHAQPSATAPYWVFLRDKQGVKFEAAKYFSPAARQRRQRQQLPSSESSDYPVRPEYVRAVRLHSDTVTYVSRWFNAVACRATPAQARALRLLPGVLRVVSRAATTPDLQPAARPRVTQAAPEELTSEDQLLAQRQTAALGGKALRRAQLTGKGLRIAVLDEGFRGLDQHPAFRQLMAHKRITDTWDFIRHKPEVFGYGSHGTEVMTCLAGQLNDSVSLGLAPEAEYLLARTERHSSERYSEEEAWLAAMEWADRHGADIINSSLGYTDRRYFREQMNGHTSLVAKAANLAARKGMLVVCSAGNDGDDPRWGVISTPADADSVLTVGALEPATWLPADFSSRGPTADRRLKPNVTAFGMVITAQPGRGFERAEGTSFSSPMVAGFAACIWQQQRSLKAMELFQKIQQSATLYPYFDYGQGYGCPQASYFLQPASPHVPTFDFVRQPTGLLQVILRPEAARSYETPLALGSAATSPATLAPLDPQPDAQLPVAMPPYVLLQVANSQGVLRWYEVRQVHQRYVASWPLSSLQPGDVIRVFYKGFTQAYTVAP